MYRAIMRTGVYAELGGCDYCFGIFRGGSNVGGRLRGSVPDSMALTKGHFGMAQEQAVPRSRRVGSESDTLDPGWTFFDSVESSRKTCGPSPTRVEPESDSSRLELMLTRVRFGFDPG